MRRPTGTREALGLSPLVKTRGTAPSVSNVFHSLPHAQDHRSFLRGDQPQSGHRMRGPDGPRLFPWSSSRSKTTDDLAGSSARAHMPHSGLVRIQQERGARTASRPELLPAYSRPRGASNRGPPLTDWFLDTDTR